MVLENLITTSSQYYWSAIAPGRVWEVFNSNDAGGEFVVAPGYEDAE
jgi:hypothetical protein